MWCTIGKVITFIAACYPKPQKKYPTSNSCKHLLSSSIWCTLGDHLQHIEPHCLWQRPALANDNLVTLFHSESWRDMCWQVWMPFFIPLVLWDKMEVISSDCDGACHLGAINCSSQDTTPDWHIACEWTFLVDVSACMPLPRCHWSGSSTNLKVRQVHSRWNKSLHLRPCLAYYSHTLSELWHIINNWQQKHISIHLWGQSYSPFGDGSLGYFP
jgi:hypothetical protein